MSEITKLLNEAHLALSLVKDNETAMKELRSAEVIAVQTAYSCIADYLFNQLNQETMDAIIKGGGDLDAARNKE